jgi:hypothetical protein
MESTLATAAVLGVLILVASMASVELAVSIANRDRARDLRR